MIFTTYQNYPLALIASVNYEEKKKKEVSYDGAAKNYLWTLNHRNIQRH